MEVHDYLIQLLAILIAARLFGEIATLFGGFAASIALSHRFFLPFGLAIQADRNFSQRIER